MQRTLALLHAASGLVLGTVWFTVLVTLWSTGLGMACTLLGLPIIWFTLVASRWMAGVEVSLTRTTLGATVTAPAEIRGWQLMARLRQRAIWHAQLYLLLRFVLGLATGTILIGLVVQGIGLIAAPAWYWAVPDGIDLGIWRIDTLAEAFAAIPAGVAAVALGWWLGGPYAALWRRLARRLLHGDSAPVRPVGVPLRVTVTVAVVAEAICLVVWAATGRPSDWPQWPALGLAIAVALHVATLQRTALRGHAVAAATAVVTALIVWAFAGGGYFWPVWVALGTAVTLGLHAIAQTAMGSERMEQLRRTRADVVDAQEDELRRIERDLHDGAQARLVSLAMSLGLAESRLDDDPDRARELMAEAQDQARTALRELRDLARGIAPPVLQDRGLTAAVEALAATAPLSVEVRGDGGRAPAAIERAGYFVAAEALANAAKYSGAEHIRITVTRFDDRLEVDVADDGRGGANPAGAGLTGLKRRVEAVDGRLDIRSPAGAGTIIRATLPCA